MRVIAGAKRGLRLRTVSSVSSGQIRPTSDRTKKVIFDVLGDSIRNAVILDAFAGCGSLGIEALSRGAGQAVFIEKNRQALFALRKNLEKTDLLSEARIFATTVAEALRILAESTSKFDFIFADPPYYQSLAQTTIADVEHYKLLEQGGWLILEHETRPSLDFRVADLILLKQKKHGDTSVSFYRYV
ncbi:16S rRNA (guanine(966)-N(2))-methyltransferase RsmD [bacterium]|nr:16S rRNA (guanine(966)-N(2))-methyltransferase RsmD [bacterium]